MTIKQNGGIFGRNPTFNNVDVESDLSVTGNVDITGTIDGSGTATLEGDVYLGLSGSGSTTVYLQNGNAQALNVFVDHNGAANASTSMQMDTTDTSNFGHKYVSFTKGVSTENGSISSSGAGIAYNTSSDYRLKENVTALTDATDRLKQLSVYRFNFISDPDQTVDGFIAHEVQEHVPEAVTGVKDAVDADGNIISQGIDQSKLVPLLVSALQNAIARIEALENA